MNIRKVGAAILRAAVRRAPPELQQWGNAMLNEMDAIGNDWTAFRWAIGGAVSLFRGFELPICNADEIPKRLDMLQKKMRRSLAVGYLACLFVGFGFARFLAMSSGSMQRLGCVLTIVGSVFLAFQLWLNHVRRRDACSGIDAMPPIDRYESVLRHMRAFHSGIWFWSRMAIFTPGPILFYFGVKIAHPEIHKNFISGFIVFVALCFLAIPLNLNRSRKFEREIERLDSFRKEQE